jgi:Queuine tRNA-ribosyltransferase
MTQQCSAHHHASVRHTRRGGQHFEFDAQPSKNSAAYVSAFRGGTFVSPRDYMRAALALEPDFCYALADETFAHPAKRRADNAIKRSKAWLQACVECVAAEGDGAGHRPALVGTVPAMAAAHHGRHAAQAVAESDEHLAGASAFAGAALAAQLTNGCCFLVWRNGVWCPHLVLTRSAMQGITLQAMAWGRLPRSGRASWQRSIRTCPAGSCAA